MPIVNTFQNANGAIMATVLPTLNPEIITNRLERDVYTVLRDSDETRDWVVYYSTTVRNSLGDNYSEKDFIALIPGRGIVLIEVKAVDRLQIHEGIWDYGSYRDRSPFDKCFSGIKNLLKHFSRDTGIRANAAFLVYFQNLNQNHTQGGDFDKFPNHFLNKSILPNGLPGHILRLFDEQNLANTPSPFAETEIKAIRNCLDTKLTYASKIKDHAESFCGNDEYLGTRLNSIFDTLILLPRAHIFGSAGTGKTALALLKAKEKITARKKVLFLCFNKLLGLEIRERLKAVITEDSFVGPIEEYMEMMAKRLPANRLLLLNPALDDSYYKNDLPNMASAYLKSINDTLKYEFLIVDELQDLLIRKYLDVIDLSVAGGLMAAEAWMFSDMDQSIFNLLEVTIPEFLSIYNFAGNQIGLNVDFRHTKNLSKTCGRVINKPDLYKYPALDIPGPSPELVTYDTPQDQAKKIEALVMNLLTKSGFAPRDIVVLSCHKGDSDKSVLRKLSDMPYLRGKMRFLDADNNKPAEKIGMASVSKYKGLQSTVVLLTDIDEDVRAPRKYLVYSGISRARFMLFMFASTKVAKEFQIDEAVA